MIVLVICIPVACIYIVIALSIVVEEEEDKWIGWLVFFTTEVKAAVVNTVVWTVITDVSDPVYVKEAYTVPGKLSTNEVFVLHVLG